MFALLGDIQFDLITYFDGFESQFGVDYAEHALIDGKPRLQRVGDKLDEIRIQLSFHLQFCDPEQELLKLRTALSAHQAMALVLGNGDYKGWFVLTDVQATSKQTDKAGALIALDASITLREFVGDKKNPLQPPAVQPKLPPVAATSLPVGQLSQAAIPSAGAALRDSIRQVVSCANQARAGLRTAMDAVAVAQQLRDNPLAAMNQVPGVVRNIERASLPLASMAPALSAVTGVMPAAATALQASSTALTAVQDAQSLLASGVTTANVASRLDSVAGKCLSATTALQSASPSISGLASKAVTRMV